MFSNALKYAFKDQKVGEIKVSLKASKTEHILMVEDNGSGIPVKVDYTNSPSLGFRLVIGLVDQIDGNISLNRTQGTQFIINFKRK